MTGGGGGYWVEPMATSKSLDSLQVNLPYLYMLGRRILGSMVPANRTLPSCLEVWVEQCTLLTCLSSYMYYQDNIFI